MLPTEVIVELKRLGWDWTNVMYNFDGVVITCGLKAWPDGTLLPCGRGKTLEEATLNLVKILTERTTRAWLKDY